VRNAFREERRGEDEKREYIYGVGLEGY